jgi:GT2 family glycosyltransferase
MKLSIIIINYNTFNMTSNCLRDIYANDWSFSFEVILVDNASIERNPDDFKNEFPAIKLVKSSKNEGFARGNNMGIDIANGEYVLILNSDTLHLNDGIKKSVQYMDAHKTEADLAGVGCKLLSLDGSRQDSSFDYRIGLKSSLFDNSIISFIIAKFGYGKYRDYKYVEKMHEKEHAVQALLGAFMLFKKKVIDTVGPFDPDFFLYYEEFEWCYRINDSGYRIMYIPEATITHIGQGTSSNESAYVNTNKQHFLSILLLNLKQSGYFGLFTYNIIFIFNLITNSFLLPFRAKSVRESHINLIKGVLFSLTHQWIMMKYFKPKFASSKFPFRLAIIEELAKTK